MIFISHRGNIDGPNTQRENHPQYIQNGLQLGYEVEIDVWFVDGRFYLGHDEPQYVTEASFLHTSGLWCHAKNLEALCEMKRLTENSSFDIHYFWHQLDDVTITSRGYIWAFPGKQPILNSIAVMPEIHNEECNHCIGICSDYIERYRR